MGAMPRPVVQFNTTLMVEDMTAKGWQKKDLARRARVSAMTVGRFFSGESQTPPTAKKLARALGHDVEHYLVRSSEAVA